MSDVVTIELASDGRSWIDGQELTAQADSLEDARAAALRYIAERARACGRSVAVNATDPDGSIWRLLVHPSGMIEAADTAEVRERASDPDAQRVPETFRSRSAAISAALGSGAEIEALTLARQMVKEVADTYGDEHPYVWRTRELLAHVQHVAGLSGEACEQYMQTALGWARLGSTNAFRSAAQHAYACWDRIDDPDRAAWLGEQLVDVLRLAGDDAEPALRAVLRSVDELRSGVIL